MRIFLVLLAGALCAPAATAWAGGSRGRLEDRRADRPHAAVLPV